jgi:hypothetical protein
MLRNLRSPIKVKRMARILVVEDERIVAFGLERSLGKLGYEVTGTAMNSAQALRLAEGYTMTTVSGAGALIWVPHGDGVRGVTWLGVETIVDPVIAGMCVEAGNTKLGIHVEKMNGDAIWTRKSAAPAGGTMPTPPPSNAQAGKTA